MPSDAGQALFVWAAASPGPDYCGLPADKIPPVSPLLEAYGKFHCCTELGCSLLLATGYYIEMEESDVAP